MEESLLDEIIQNRPKKPVPKWLNNLEKVLVYVSLLGFIFRLLHWKGGSALIIISMGSLSFLYALFYFTVDNTEYRPKALKIIMILGGWVLAANLFGVVFQLMSWTGRDNLTPFSFITVLIGLIVFYLGRNGNISKPNARRLCTRFFAFGVISIILLFMPLKAKTYWLYGSNASPNLLEAAKDVHESPNDSIKIERYLQLKQQHFDSMRAIEYGSEYNRTVFPKED